MDIKKARLIHYAIMGATVFYALVGFVVGGQLPLTEGAEPLPTALFIVFSAIAGTLTFASFKVPRLIDGKRKWPEERTLPSYLVAWSLGESIAVIGLVVHFIDPHRNFQNLLVFVGWGVIVLRIHAPRFPKVPR